MNERVPQISTTIRLSVRGLNRRFGYRRVIRNLTLDVEAGSVLVLIGHNGAGKTTLIRLLAGLLKPTSGTVTREGSFGLVAHDSMFYDSLTAKENLRFFGNLVGSAESSRIEELLLVTGLTEHAERRVEAFSRGMVQRLTMARALLHDPELLLLDEPMTGLDDAATTTVQRLLADLASRNRSIVLATHHLPEVVHLATEVGFLVSGEMKALEPIGGRDSRALMDRYRELVQNG